MEKRIITTPEMPSVMFSGDFEEFLGYLREKGITMNIVEWLPPGDNYAAMVTFTGEYDAIIEMGVDEFGARDKAEAEEFMFGE